MLLVILVLIAYSILHRKMSYFIILMITFLIGFTCYSLYINNRTYKVPNMYSSSCVGTVVSIKTYDNSLSLLLEDVKIDGQKQDYNVTVYYYNVYQEGYIKLNVGSKISFNIERQSEVDKFTEDGLPHTYNYKNNIGAEFVTYNVTLLEENTKIRTGLLAQIRENLRLGFSNFNGEMIYSAMFGDKAELNSDLYDAYKSAGVAHLLAVSGLHVGLVVAILNWIMKRCKIKGWWRVAITGVLLVGYAYLCGFSYSIIRASIMAMVLLIAPIMFSEYDLLSSICFAGSLILLIDPIALFDVSALLSFGCVIGIAMLYPIFKQCFIKVPITDKVKDGFSISLATIISTFAIMAYFFRYVQPVGLISNIIIIPIFSILFTLSFIVVMLSLLLPFVSYSLILLNPLFETLNWFIIFIANNTKSIPIYNINFLSILIFFALITFVSKFNLKKGVTKINMVLVCLCVLALQVALV
ncbi:MAG: ComEC/Rec2 family competence protein [Clostridia bacterium]